MLSTHQNAFMMDFENSCLETYSRIFPHFPKGNLRHEDPEWAKFMKSEISKSSELTWEEYKMWVEDGGGDEWFIEPEQEKPQ